MNEVTKIHLGRQAFTISIDAYHELRSYLDAIQKQVGDKEVVEEIELRMAELLTEHGVKQDQVILKNDVAFLKKQLGSPKDFTEDDEEPTQDTAEQPEGKRLFRDTDHAIIAGVVAGLANYFGIDVLLARLLFMLLLLITAGWGVLLYILLWLLVPVAKTPSDKLQMAGKAVTVHSLKAMVAEADVKGTARRAGSTIAEPLNTLFHFLLKVVGVGFILVGLSGLFGLVTGSVYFWTKSSSWAQDNIFPVSVREQVLFSIGIGIAALVAIFIILFGVAIFRRRWPIKAWVTGILIGLIFIGIATGAALAADVYPTVRDRYYANLHTTVRSVQPFTLVNPTDDNVNINYQLSSKYYVSFNYYGHPNIGAIRTSVSDDTLVIDTSQFDWSRNCRVLCIPPDNHLNINVYAPNPVQFETDVTAPPFPKPAPIYR